MDALALLLGSISVQSAQAQSASTAFTLRGQVTTGPPDRPLAGLTVAATARHVQGAPIGCVGLHPGQLPIDDAQSPAERRGAASLDGTLDRTLFHLDTMVPFTVEAHTAAPPNAPLNTGGLPVRGTTRADLFTDARGDVVLRLLRVAANDPYVL